jgi:hypothetical protein
LDRNKALLAEADIEFAEDMEVVGDEVKSDAVSRVWRATAWSGGHLDVAVIRKANAIKVYTRMVVFSSSSR